MRALCTALLLTLAAPAAAITPLGDFSASRYQGRWYEIAAMPGAFRNQCQRDVQIEYASEEGGAFVLRNRCRRSDGEMLETEGRGRALDPDVPAVLKVTFVHGLGIWWYPLGRNQTVIAAGPRYSWLVLADTTLRYGRIIAREPTLDIAALRAIDAALAAEGYDRCAFVLKPQTGGRSEPARLCDEVRVAP
ncbi:MAG TPA: lipocalin family protein [Casimicrobiaceae bacterium]|nr:lipocalin family protein [Casimicrobiaceae bacterium]